MKPLITVIVPVYNIELYLERCIQSILKQTWKNWELFLVDDGSKDTSGSICDKYAEMEQRIKVIHKENGGQSSARNVALEISNGEWIFYVDGDDYIAPDTLEYLLKFAIKQHCNVVNCAVKHIGFSGVYDPVDTSKCAIYNGKEACKYVLLGINGFSASASHTLFSKQLVGKMKFLEGLIYEDLEYMVRVCCKAERVGISTSQKYFYCYRPDNSSYYTNTKKKVVDLYLVEKAIKETLEKQNPELLPCLETRMISNYQQILYYICSFTSELKLYYKPLRKKILSYKYYKIDLSKTDKVIYKCLCFNQYFFHLAMLALKYGKRIFSKIRR